MHDLPRLALSVRQPWAWAIIHGGKVIENRSAGAIRAGRMTTGPICIHAAKGMRRDEYEWALWRLDRHGVTCPPPADLPRGAIIGTVEVTEIISQSDSPWFGGDHGLVLAKPRQITPIPAKGALGYFAWERAAALAPALPWMRRYSAQHDQPGLFETLPPGFREPPQKPFGRDG